MSSTTAAGKHEWLVIVPDHEGALEKRLAARGKHLENIKADGPKWLMGGAFLSSPHTDPTSTPAMAGSAMIVLADSEEEVRQRLREDVYAKEGAWDVQNAKVWPFKSAVRVGI